MTRPTESKRGLPELPFDQLPMHAQAVLLADELEVEADRITRYSNSSLDGLLARSANVLRALAAIEQDRASRASSGAQEDKPLVELFEELRNVPGNAWHTRAAEVRRAALEEAADLCESLVRYASDAGECADAIRSIAAPGAGKEGE